MAFIKFPSASDLSDLRRGRMLNAYKGSTEVGTYCTCVTIPLANVSCYSRVFSDRKKLKKRNNLFSYFDVSFAFGPINIYKEESKFSFSSHVHITVGNNCSPPLRLNRSGVFGVEEAMTPPAFCKSVERDSRITCNSTAGSRFTSEKPAKKVTQYSVKKNWKQFIRERKKGGYRRYSRKFSEMKIEKLDIYIRTLADADYDETIGLMDAATSKSITSIDKCNSLLKMLERSNDEKALNYFQWMKRNNKLVGNTTAYNIILRVLGRKEDWNAAESMLEEMNTESGCQINCQAFNALIFVCYKRGLVKQGSKWFHKMLQSGVQPNLATFGMIMGLYKRSNNLTEAKFAFDRMRRLKLHCQTAYSAMITIFTRLGLHDKSEQIINMMRDDNVLPNLENWLVQLKAYSQQGKLDKAELVLESMQDAGITPNIVAYNTLITGYGKVGDMESASNTFLRLQSTGMEPDETTYRSMIEGYGKIRNYEMTLLHYKKLKHSGFHPNSSNLYTVINLQAAYNDDVGILETINDMRIMGCAYSSILESLFQAYENVQRMNQVPFILKKASIYEKLLLDQTCCSMLAMAFVENNLIGEAMQILSDKQWEDKAYEEHLNHLLICTCKEAYRFEDAVKIFSQMPKSQTSPNLFILSSMIDIYTLMGQFKNGEDLYLKLKSWGVALDVVTYSVVIRMYIKNGFLKDACAVLDSMENQKDIIPDVYLFRDMLRIYQQCDMREKLKDVYCKVLKSGITWDEAMYNCVINCCARALPVDELSRLFDQMVQHGFSANTITFNIMLDVYGKAGLLKKARKVLWMARKQRMADAISHSTVIAAYGKQKDFKNMKSIFRRMEYAGIPIPLEAYNSMLDAYGKEDRIEEFKETLQKMRETSCVSDHYTYNIMINIYGKKGWIEEVATALTELKDRGLKPDLYSYNSLIKAYGMAGMVEEAVNVVKEMRGNGIDPDKVTYVNLIGALQKNDNFLEAVKWSLWMKQLGMAR